MVACTPFDQGVQVTYRIKAPTKGKDRGKRIVASIFRETDPNNFKPESPETAGGGGVPGQEGPLSRQDTARAFSSSVTREPADLPATENIGPERVNEKAPSISTEPARTGTAAAPALSLPEGRIEAEGRVGRPEEPRADPAAEMGVDPETGDFDELGQVRALEAAGELAPEELEAIKAAAALKQKADDYAAAYEAAATCLSRNA